MTIHTGTFRGGTITLDDAPDLPDGRRVLVTVEPADASAPPPRDPDGFARVAGALRDAPEEVDAFVAETYRLRRSGRDG